jgi:hypothetical protein
MKSRATLIAFVTILTAGAAAPSWAQGSLEKDDNGPRMQTPGQSPGAVTVPNTKGTSGTAGQGRDSNTRLPNAPNAQTGGRPNNPTPGPTDRSGNAPSENR